MTVLFTPLLRILFQRKIIILRYDINLYFTQYSFFAHNSNDNFI